jgi:Virulence-associated protein E
MNDPFEGSMDDIEPDVRRIMDAKEAKETAKADSLEELRREPDIIKRAKAMEPYIAFPVTKGNPIAIPVPCDENLFFAFDMLFGKDPNGERPHIDEFRGALVDHRGEKINKHYPVKDWVTALSKVGLKQYKAETVREGLREYALTCRRNDLCVYIESVLPAWDGTPRMEEYLWKLFKCFDTPFNRLMSRYFWMSLYMRCMHPGSDAPIVISLIGDQMNGKSFFSKRLAQIITGNKDADSVKLDLRNHDKFLRQITGNSCVATIPEMRGFAQAEHNATKDFVTLTADNFDQKWELNIVQQRQWVIVMDSNKYEGLLRDDTGNRRFAPMFVAQLPDKNNKPDWEVKHSIEDGEKFNAGPYIASAAFANDVMQLMAEARAWLGEHGLEAYGDLVADAATEVQHFSDSEMKRESGTIGDFVIDTYLDAGIDEAEGAILSTRGERYGKAMFVGTANLIEAMGRVANEKPLQINPYKLKEAMKARGAEPYKRMLSARENGKIVNKGYVNGFIFYGIGSKPELIDHLVARHGLVAQEGDESAAVEYLPKGDGPF